MVLNTEKPWPHNAWYHAAWCTELESGAKPLARTLLNEDLVIYIVGFCRPVHVCLTVPYKGVHPFVVAQVLLIALIVISSASPPG